MTINTDFRVAVINKSGNIGKTTVSRVLLKMRMPNAELISIEDLNADGQEDKNGQMVQASKFKQVYQALMYSPSVILDIGSSNLKETMQLMRQSEGSHDEIDYFLVPVVEDIVTVKQLIERLKNEDALVLVPYELEDVKLLKDVLQEPKQNYYIVIGPEGGFDIKEIELFQEIGAHIVTLGKRILRTETAGIVAASVVMYECNEMQ